MRRRRRCSGAASSRREGSTCGSPCLSPPFLGAGCEQCTRHPACAEGAGEGVGQLQQGEGGKVAGQTREKVVQEREQREAKWRVRVGTGQGRWCWRGQGWPSPGPPTSMVIQRHVRGRVHSSQRVIGYVLQRCLARLVDSGLCKFRHLPAGASGRCGGPAPRGRSSSSFLTAQWEAPGPQQRLHGALERGGMLRS